MAKTFDIKSRITLLADKFTGPLAEVNKKINAFQAPIKKLHNSVRKFSKDLGIPKVAKSWNKLSKSVGKVGQEFKNLGKTVAIVSGVAAAALGSVVLPTASAADSAYKTAQKVGVTTESWTKLAHAADMSGVSTSTLQNGMTRLNKSIADASNGNKGAVEMFNKLGMSIYDQSGKLKTADVVLAEIAEKCSKMEDGSVKTADAMAVFGKAVGPELIPMLNAGKAGLMAYAEEAAQAGIVITDEQGKAAELFNDSMARVRVAIKGVVFSIGNQLIPVIQPLLADIKEWIEGNRELVKTKVSEWIERIQKRLPEIKEGIKGVWERGKELGKSIDELVQRFGGWEAVLPKVGMALVALKLAPLALAILGLGKAVVSFGGAFASVFIKIGALMVANPILILIAAIAGGVYLIYKNWDGIVVWFSNLWQKVKATFSSAWESICSSVSSAWESIAGVVNAIGEQFAKAGAVIAGFGVAVWDGVVVVWDRVTGALSDKFSAIHDAFENGFINGLLEALWQFNPLRIFMDTLSAAKDWIMGFDMIQAGVSLAQKLGEGILSAWESIKDTIKSKIVECIPGGETIVNVAGTVKDAAVGVASSAYNTAASLGGSVRNFFTGGSSDLSSSAIPKMARGGIVTHPQFALIGEAGPEAVIPLSPSARSFDLLGLAANAIGLKSFSSSSGDGTESRQTPRILSGSSSTGDWKTVSRTERSESVRDARVTVEFVNAPPGMTVKKQGNVQTQIRHSASFDPAYTGVRMGF